MIDKRDSRQMITHGQVLSVCTCGHSDLVIYQPIFSKLHAYITFIKGSPKFEYKFCLIYDNKIVAKMAAACRFALLDTLI